MAPPAATTVLLLGLGLLLASPVTVRAGVAPLTGTHGAAKRGDVAELRRLLAMGVDPNHLTQGKITPLMWAAAEGHVEAAQLLIDAGAKTEPKSSLGADALQLAKQSIPDLVIRARMEAVCPIFPSNSWIFNRKFDLKRSLPLLASIFLLKRQELWGNQVLTGDSSSPADPAAEGSPDVGSEWEKADQTCSGAANKPDAPTMADMAQPAMDPFAAALTARFLSAADRETKEQSPPQNPDPGY